MRHLEGVEDNQLTRTANNHLTASLILELKRYVGVPNVGSHLRQVLGDLGLGEPIAQERPLIVGLIAEVVVLPSDLLDSFVEM